MGLDAILPQSRIFQVVEPPSRGTLLETYVHALNVVAMAYCVDHIDRHLDRVTTVRQSTTTRQDYHTKSKNAGYYAFADASDYDGTTVRFKIYIPRRAKNRKSLPRRLKNSVATFMLRLYEAGYIVLDVEPVLWTIDQWLRTQDF